MSGKVQRTTYRASYPASLGRRARHLLIHLKGQAALLAPFVHRALDLGGKRLVMLGEPGEQFSLLFVGCQAANHVAFGDLHP
jgi:hypothetical protein